MENDISKKNISLMDIISNKNYYLRYNYDNNKILNKHIVTHLILHTVVTIKINKNNFIYFIYKIIQYHNTFKNINPIHNYNQKLVKSPDNCIYLLYHIFMYKIENNIGTFNI